MERVAPHSRIPSPCFPSCPDPRRERAEAEATECARTPGEVLPRFLSNILTTAMVWTSLYLQRWPPHPRTSPTPLPGGSKWTANACPHDAVRPSPPA
ncbi:hypothetical protein GCM10018773_27620 [Streptomyces candidus]|nr:hypothetical protein GCM10018773_27620 [Streptomyces candidus]